MARHYFSDAARAKYAPGAIVGNTALASVPAPVSRKRRLTGDEDEDNRKDMLAKVHMAKAALAHMEGWTDDAYRALLYERYNVESAAELGRKQLHDLLLYFARLGWRHKPRKVSGREPAALSGDISGLSREGLLHRIRKQLEAKGQAEGTGVPWNYAVAILKRQSGGVTKSLDQADRRQLEGVIAALWRDAKRKGRKVR